MLRKYLAAALLLATASPAFAGYTAQPPIKGPDGGWDYAAVDSAKHRLYVARGDSVTVIDTATATLVGSFGSIAHGHAALPLPNGRLFVTSGDDATVHFLDAADGHQLASVAVGKKPDAALYDPATRHAFVMNAAGGSVSEIDVAAMKVVKTIPAKEGLEFGAMVGATLFVNDEDTNEIETFDVARGVMGAPIALPGCEGPSGLGYDAAGGRLIAACANGKAAVVDVKSRKLASLVDIGIGPDAVIIDRARKLALLPCGKDGVLDVLSIAGPKVTKVARVKTETGARTGTIDPATGIVYLPTARLEAAPQQGRPKPVPGTFHVLPYKPN